MGRVLRRKPPAELGRLVDVHRPLHPVLGWGLILLVALVLTPFATNGDVAPLPVYAVIFVCLCYGEALVLGPSLLLEHRLYEHGLVLRTMMIGTPVYVVPHYTVRPSLLYAVPKRPESELGSQEKPARRKCAFSRPGVRLHGLGTHSARMLGKGKLTWDEAARQGSGRLPGGQRSASAHETWEIDYRDAPEQLKLLTRTVLASHRVHPYRMADD